MPHASRPGDVLGERYRLVDLLTESDGGRFWRAYDQVLERHVAIHVIRGDDDRAPALMDAARRSAMVLDPRVLRVLDAERGDDECYVVNEWGWGASLDVVVNGTGALAARRAAWLVAEVADSVAVAHAAGVAHGRLNPENVLVDRAGGVRLIGLGVDAALHGLDPAADEARDRDLRDLAGLLYCALTTRWAGPSGSIVAPAPRSHGGVLRPRQVRAGIPRPLDQLCDDLLHPSADGRPRDPHAPTSAREVADLLHDFVGDAAGMPAALVASTPDVLPDEEQVVLPPVPDLLPHDGAPPDPAGPATTVVEAGSATGVGAAGGAAGPAAADGIGTRGAHDATRGAEGEPPSTPTDESAPSDLPTEAGVPIFGDDDVSWLERRTAPVPPPPPFEAPPERPLFAAESRTPRRTPEDAADRSDGFWPWEPGPQTGTGAGTGGLRAVAGSDGADAGGSGTVPGRVLLRLAILIGVVALLVVAVVVVVRVTGSEGGTSQPESPGTADPGSSSPPSASPTTSPVLQGVTATAFDPQGDDRSENDDEAPDAVDGDPATAWTTVGYNDQLGPPPGLKLGVGLVLELPGPTAVRSVDLTLVGAPTSVSVYVTDDAPESVDDLEPAAEGTADGDSLTLETPDASGSYVVVWLTALPVGDDGQYRGGVAEAVVRGDAA